MTDTYAKEGFTKLASALIDLNRSLDCTTERRKRFVLKCFKHFYVKKIDRTAKRVPYDLFRPCIIGSTKLAWSDDVLVEEGLASGVEFDLADRLRGAFLLRIVTAVDKITRAVTKEFESPLEMLRYCMNPKRYILKRIKEIASGCDLIVTKHGMSLQPYLFFRKWRPL